MCHDNEERCNLKHMAMRKEQAYTNLHVNPIYVE